MDLSQMHGHGQACPLLHMDMLISVFFCSVESAVQVCASGVSNQQAWSVQGAKGTLVGALLVCQGPNTLQAVVEVVLQAICGAVPHPHSTVLRACAAAEGQRSQVQTIYANMVGITAAKSNGSLFTKRVMSVIEGIKLKSGKIGFHTCESA